ncbi:MAG: transcriptional regulator [gamma proteobacterium symbiont of Ctena orbiculata]|uniref:P-II family nitrogen regulator n=1 Tax=Candidatus Thiodiazotropha taylori TaxID=2792791 RepID=A0A944QWF9_9GAMM|nr:P-II family nitrogen regulator [Candidatus Thiodiazotropha taylori]PUB90021.1 MAG: transcriptional regulator [gamma proteobacterium symbiont of Ctena orbiculata]MBT2991039.1 P-II family nitrogen regulator [Candidatus Thiodiazotropha taylori]MBT2996623.1 P-II family nitrogen regulator [Candidatus Thiodiazotropha taylori]MBT3000663.1 P-II family nitrogen regulator [Candidatus Thiodiazotropha taylori]
MSTREIVVLTDVALITASVQRGMADAIVKAAQEAGAQGASIHYAHGRGVRERLGIWGLALEAEKEVINIVVSSDQVDRVFEKMYLAGKMDTPGMGFMWVTPLEKAATFVPPEIVDRLTAHKATNRS